jgi:DNA-binding winged helix-turn-helix (wHTH) protein
MSDASRVAGTPIRVGEFLLDPPWGALRSDGGRQNLSTQPLQVLLALIDRPGEVVTRDELIRRLWPAGTYVDFEHGLNVIVKRLRDALGDAADTPRYIETVPRRGYRLVAAQAAFVELLQPVGCPGRPHRRRPGGSTVSS